MSSRPYLFATTASSSPRRASSGLAVRLWRSARPRRPTAPPSAVRISCSASQPNDPRVPAAELPGGVWWMSAPLGGGAAAGPLKNAASVRGFGEGFIILDSSGSSTTDTPPPTENFGLQRMDGQQSRNLVMGSALGGAATHFCTGDVIEVELVPMEEDSDAEWWMEEEEGGAGAISGEECLGIVLHAALGPQRGTAGLVPQAPQSPSEEVESGGGGRRRSPRRTQPVRFTCNICQTRTTRVVNPYAWKHGTVFLECSGCHVKHKVKDNLNLFFEGSDDGGVVEEAVPPPPPADKPKRSKLLDPTNLSWALERDADWRLPNENNRP